MIARALVVLLFLVGLAGFIIRRNLIKKTFALSIMNSAVVILFVLEGGRVGDTAPLLDEGGASVAVYVDPMPQALMLTAIVVGVCVSALALALAFRLYREYGSLDIEKLRRRVDHE